MNNIKVRPVGQPSAPVGFITCRQGKRQSWRKWPAKMKKAALRAGLMLVGTRQS